jgi:hypothetical protein
MNSSNYVGRVGGLAVALGVGAAIFSGAGTAWAGPDSSAPPGPSTTDGSGDRASDVGSAIRKAVKDSLSNVAAVGAHVRDLGNGTNLRTNLHDLADNLGAHLTTATTTPLQQRASGTNKPVVKTPLAARPLPTLGAVEPRLSRVTEALSPGAAAQNLSETLDSITAPLRVTSNTGTATTGVAAAVAAVANQVLRPFTHEAPSAPPPAVPLTGLTNLVQLAGLRRGMSGAATTLDQPTASAVNPTFVLNGYKIVADPESPEKVKSFYGLFTIGPAGPGMVQGEQEYDVVDSSGTTVGNFKALVSNSNAFIVFGGGRYQEFVVTETDGIGAPPVGTLVATSRSPLFGLFGILYTSTPTGVDEREVSLKLLTPFGDVPIPLKYDAAQVLTAVNEPMQLENGYYIAPAPGHDEIPVSISGVVPLFSSYQGEQVFNVYQTGNPEPVGSFKGYVTTTSDAIGGATEAIYVTEYISGPTDVIPGPGSVYNVFRSKRAVYSAVVPPGGGPAVVTFRIGTPLGTINVPMPYDATDPPTHDSFSVPGKYSFVPASEFVPIGVNGLPPREVQLQGYQKFKVLDSSGNEIGTVDADVTTQWGITGTYVESILITNVTGVPEGTDPASVPTVGSQYSQVYYPASGFGLLYTSIASPSGDKNTYTLLTPLGNVNVPISFHDPVKGLGPDNVDYFVP